MEIKRIDYEYVDEKPFAGLVESDEPFVPHWSAKIVTDRGVYHGEGETEQAAEDDAMEHLKYDLSVDAIRAMEKYNASHGAGNLDIA